MVRNIDYAKLSKTLECGICLSVVHNPKALVCDHTFCRACLDKILVFAPNGSASIKCPNGCDSETLISPTQTTNDLKINYMLKSVLDLTVEETGDDDPNSTTMCSTCLRNATQYCTECCVFKCDHCPEAHDKSDELIPIDVHCSDGKGAIVCQEHLAEAEYACCKTQFVCTYCVHRGKHKQHEYQLLADVDQANRDFIRQKLDANIDFENMKKRAMSQIKHVEKYMDRELKRRKLLRMMDYMDYLDKEEVKISKNFEKVSKDYQSAFESMGFFQKYHENDDFLLRLSMNKIRKTKESVYMNDVNRIPGTVVSLGVDRSHDSFPLGRLKATHCSLCEGFQGNFATADEEQTSLQPAQSLMDKVTKLIKDLDDDVENDSECESGDDSGFQEFWNSVEKTCCDEKPEVLSVFGNHECMLKPIPSLTTLQNNKYLAESSFELQNVSKLYGRVIGDPFTLNNFVFRVGLLSFEEKDVKYAFVFVQCDYKGYKSSWSLQCDIKIRLKAVRGIDVTDELSMTFTKEINAHGSLRTIKWDVLIDPQKGLLSKDDSLRIETVIEWKSLKE